MGVFANAMGLAIGQRQIADQATPRQRQPLATWLLDRFHRREQPPPRLALVERIHLAPRQTLALIEADGQRLLVATSADGAAAFFDLASCSRLRTTARSRKPANEKKDA